MEPVISGSRIPVQCGCRSKHSTPRLWTDPEKTQKPWVPKKLHSKLLEIHINLPSSCKKTPSPSMSIYRSIYQPGRWIWPKTTSWAWALHSSIEDAQLKWTTIQIQ